MNSDRISYLPEELITQSILGRMPIRDAVRTGILSRNWRHKWATLPDLVFNVRTFSPQLQDEGKLVETISRILLQHKGPINKFSLLINKAMKSYSMIDIWLQFLSNNGAIKDFILQFIDGSGYKIHSSLFSCANLRHLELKGCIIPSPPPTMFNGFNNLTFLRLESVGLNNEVFENLIAKCPQLNGLYLYYVNGPDRLNIHHAPRLEKLNFHAYLIKHISLKYTPSLLYVAFVSFQLPDMNQNLGNGESTSLINNLNCLSNVKELKLGYYFLKFLAQDSIRMQLPSTFNYLSTIHFLFIMFEDLDSVSSALGLIASSPNLHKLVVKAWTDSLAAQAQMKTVTEYLEVRRGSTGSLMQLKYVEMNNIQGLGPELQFIKMILGNSPLLREMKIQHAKEVTDCPVTESKILKELIRLPRASAVAEILY